MLIFRNPGLIDLEAVRTLGVSVKLPGSFGRFGTGLKFALATILRGGGAVAIYRGLVAHPVSTQRKVIRGESFDVVTLDGEPLGITTQLGRDWEPWMVLRELGCNALDEAGEFDLLGSADVIMEGFTTITVDWPDLDLAYAKRDELFLPSATEPLYQTAAIRILPGPSRHIFYRGVRVAKLDRPTAVTYDLLAEQRLTEDRTLAYFWPVDKLLVDTYLTIPDVVEDQGSESDRVALRALLVSVIAAGEEAYEHSLDFANCSYGVRAGKPFLAAALEAREGAETSRKLNVSVRLLLLRHMRAQVGQEGSALGGYARVESDSFDYARDALAEIGVRFDPDQAFIMVDELPGEAKSLVESGRVYILNSLLGEPARVVVTELLARWVDLHVSSYDVESAVRLLAPVLIERMAGLVEDERLVAEDRAMMQGVGDLPGDISLADSWEPLDRARGAISPDEDHQWLIEGEWSGYTSEQTKIVHREFVNWATADKLDGAVITFTDGTTLTISSRQVAPGEKVQENRSYSTLIRDCMAAGVWSVQQLVDLRKVEAEAETRKQPASTSVSVDQAATNLFMEAL